MNLMRHEENPMEMHPAKRWYLDNLGEQLTIALIKNRFDAIYFSSTSDAKDHVLSQIPEKATVGIGGSVTIRELGLIEELERRGHTVSHHWKPELGHNAAGGRVDGFVMGDDFDVRRRAMMSDVYLCSSNAITMDGKLVNMDGFGNRVASMIFGPRQTIIVVSIYKAVKDVNAGIERITTLTAPMSAHRGRGKVPCAVSGQCTDCDAPDRSCGVMTIMHKKPKGSRILIVLVGEELGF
jgi:hypothetical protein